MKNGFILAFISLAVLVVGLGCGISDRVQKAVTGEGDTNNAAANSNKSITDRAVDTAVADGKIGIPECDEAIDILVSQANDPNDNFVTKAVKKTALNTFREQIKKGIGENNTNRTQTAKFCRDFKKNLDESLSESRSNTK